MEKLIKTSPEAKERREKTALFFENNKYFFMLLSGYYHYPQDFRGYIEKNAEKCGFGTLTKREDGYTYTADNKVRFVPMDVMDEYCRISGLSKEYLIRSKVIEVVKSSSVRMPKAKLREEYTKKELDLFK